MSDSDTPSRFVVIDGVQVARSRAEANGWIEPINESKGSGGSNSRVRSAKSTRTAKVGAAVTTPADDGTTPPPTTTGDAVPNPDGSTPAPASDAGSLE